MTLSPPIRLALRAVAAGVLAALVQIQQGGTQIAWHSVVVAGGLALLEYLTPLNGLVGVGAGKSESPPLKSPK